MARYTIKYTVTGDMFNLGLDADQARDWAFEADDVLRIYCDRWERRQIGSIYYDTTVDLARSGGSPTLSVSWDVGDRKPTDDEADACPNEARTIEYEAREAINAALVEYIERART